MEKVVVVHGRVSLIVQEDVAEVNALLEQGWTVKHIKMHSTDHCTSAIFVLEKKTNEDGDGFEEVGEVYLHDDPFDI